MDRLVRQYDPEGAFDEVFVASCTPRAHYRRLVGLLEELGVEELARRDTMREATFRTKGITRSTAMRRASSGPSRST